MQAMNKIQQQQQQQPTSQKLQIDVDVMKKLIEELEIGKNSVHIIRSLILQNYPNTKVEDSSCNNKNNDDDNHQDYYKELERHAMVALNTFLNSISMLKSSNSDGIFVETPKFDHLGHCEVVSPNNNSCNSGVSANQGSIVDDRRERFKKRKVSGELREKEVTHLTYDGFRWRKYGQKVILNHCYPRQYYRCRNKPEQNCQARKQIQQVSDNPIKYKLVYDGYHTCNNVLEISPDMIDSPKEHSSTIVLNFDGSNPANTLLFPTSSCPDNLPVSDDPAGTTNVAGPSNQVPDNYTSTASPIYLEDEYLNNIVADLSKLKHLWSI